MVDKLHHKSDSERVLHVHKKELPGDQHSCVGSAGSNSVD